MSFRFVDNLSMEARTTLFLFTQYFGPAAAAAYLGIWLTDKGLTPSEIGFVNSAPILMILVFNLGVGRIADRAKDWRDVIVAGSLIAAVMPFLLFFPNSFWPILILWTLSVIPYTLVMPVAEAATMRMTRRRGTEYARLRAFGTVGYVFAMVTTGFIADRLGPASFVPIFCVLAVIRAGASLILPNFREPGEVRVPSVKDAHKLVEVMKPWFILPILGFAVVQSTHYVLTAFGAMAWKNAGVPPAWIGPLLSLGAIAEVMMMFGFTRFARRFTARHLIMTAGIVGCIRWFVVALDPPIWILAITQLSHAFTFALGYLGMINFIANWTDDDVAAQAQSFAVVLQQAMAIFSTIFFGFLFEPLGLHAFYVASAIALCGAGLVWISLRQALPRKEVEAQEAAQAD